MKHITQEEEQEKLADKKRQKILEQNIPQEQLQIIKQPYNFALLKGSMKKTQQKQLILIMDALQPKIESWLVMSREEQNIQPRLFDDSMTDLTVSIRLKDLGITTQHYETVKAAAELLSRQIYEYPTVDKDGNRVRAFSPLFKKVSFPEKYQAVKKKAVYIEFKFNDEILKSDLMLMSHYTKYNRLVAMNSSLYTSKLYVILSAYIATAKKQWSIGYEDLRHIIGVDEINGKNWKKSKYPQYFQFRKYILESSKKELEDIASHGNCEFTYSYKEVFNAKGTEPASIIFRLQLTDKGKVAAEFDRKRKLAAKLLQDTFNMNYTDVSAIRPALFELEEDTVQRIIGDVHDRIKSRKTIVNISGYVVRSINNEVELLIEQAEAEANAQEAEATEIKDDGQLSLSMDDSEVDANEILRRIVYGELSDQSFIDIWNKVQYDSYDRKSNHLYLKAADSVVEELESHPAFTRFAQILKKYYGDNLLLYYR